MRGLWRRIARFPALSLSGALLWGVFEFLALQRSHYRGK